MGFAKIRPRRGTKNQWSIANTVLSEGEWGVECPSEGIGTGLISIKIGDGSTPWNDLPYAYKDIRKDVVQSTTITEEGKLMDGKTCSDALADKSDKDHLHDDRYYTETEVDNLLNGKSNVTHGHSYSEISGTPNSLPASDVYAWAKAKSKPGYSYSEISSRPTFSLSGTTLTISF